MSLDDPIADIVRKYLLDQNLGVADTSATWAIFSGLLPDLPDEAIACYDVGGRFDGRSMRTGEKFEHPGVQVTIRGFDYTTTLNKSNAICQSFDFQYGTVVEVSSGHIYTLQNISRTSPLISLGIGEDDRRRYHFTINAVLTLKEG